jgi:hypothetical protein
LVEYYILILALRSFKCEHPLVGIISVVLYVLGEPPLKAFPYTERKGAGTVIGVRGRKVSNKGGREQQREQQRRKGERGGARETKNRKRKREAA